MKHMHGLNSHVPNTIVVKLILLSDLPR